MRKLPLGNNAIMYGDIDGCGACKSQDLILKKYGKGSFLYKYSPLNNPASKILKGYGIPTWYIPTGNGMGVLHEGVIDKDGVIINGKHIKLRNLVKNSSFRFGETIPAINTLATYGKNFSDGKGFQVGTPFIGNVTNTWGDPLLSGTLGREFGPGNTNKIYDNNYFNNIRMAYPGGDLDTVLNLNRTCNQYTPVPSGSGPIADPVVNYPGMIYNSPNTQMVNMTGFGKRKKKSYSRKKVLEKRKTKLKKFLRTGPLKRLIKGKVEHNSRVGANFRKNKKKWKLQLKKIEKKLKQIKTQMLRKNRKTRKKRKTRKNRKTRKTRFGNFNLYSQMGTVPETQYLLNKNTFNNMYAGGGQSTQQKPYQVNSPQTFIGQSKLYNPIQSITSFGVRVKQSNKKIKKMKEINKPKIKVVKSQKESKQKKLKKPKIKLVKSQKKKQNKSKKLFDTSTPKIKEGATISVNGFGKIKIH